jgi:hypothetical protein
MFSLFNIAQIGLMVSGVLSVYLSQTPRFARYACIVGMLGEPCWFYSAFAAHQWGIMVLACWYTFCWGKGLWIYWVHPAMVRAGYFHR